MVVMVVRGLLDAEALLGADDADVADLAVLTVVLRERVCVCDGMSLPDGWQPLPQPSSCSSRLVSLHDGDGVGIILCLAHADEESALLLAVELLDGILAGDAAPVPGLRGNSVELREAEDEEEEDEKGGRGEGEGRKRRDEGKRGVGFG